ncbi:MAG: cupin domain-containing protein [Bacteroidales bacterium]|nr:cupin domain-containing protein [Bacteroidales bacterium]
MIDANYWIKHLNLMPHPEGGYFKEIYRSSIKMNRTDLPFGYQSERRLCTSIYYLLESGQFSRFHRIRSDEMWYYHHGSSIKIYMIDKEGNKQSCVVGPRIEKAEKPQLVVPAGTIFAARLVDKDSYGIFGCMVAPGFDYLDYELFEKDDLLQAFPRHADLIERFF